MSRKRSSDWKLIEDDKEKYAAYLCSREWAEIREQVRKRAKDTCERCGVLPMDSCHHLTYARKYREKMDDLQAICNPCHQFTHGKSEFDPANRLGSQLLEFLTRSPWPGDAVAFDWCLDEFPASLAEHSHGMRAGFNAWLANADACAAVYRVTDALRKADLEDVIAGIENGLEDALEWTVPYTPFEQSELPKEVAFWFRWFGSGCPGLGMDWKARRACIDVAQRARDSKPPR